MSRIDHKTAFWRRCLVDTIFENGCRTQRKHGLIAQPISCRERGIAKTLPPPPKSANSSTSSQAGLQELTLFPEGWVLHHDHGLASTQYDSSGQPPMWLPFALPVVLNRQDQRLWPAAQPYIPRDLLAPDWDSSDQPIMALLSDHDAFRSAHPFAPDSPMTLSPGLEAGSPEHEQQLEDIDQAHRKAWAEAMAYLDALRNAVSASPRSALTSGVLVPLAEAPSGDQGSCFLTPEPLSDAPIRQQLRVFDELLEHATQPPALYRRFAADAPASESPLFNNAQGFCRRLAHSTGQHPLAAAQRHAMNHLVLGTDDGNILAVNGPPGTGKTTLLLSIVANLWTQAALEGASRPPIIVGASATNQAVTNIIDAFYKDFDTGTGPLAGRWLPTSLVWSYGTYRPSASALKRAKKQAAPGSEDHSAPMYFQKLLERLIDPEHLDAATSEYIDRGAAWLDEVPRFGKVETLLELAGDAATRYLVDALHQDIEQRSRAIKTLYDTLEDVPARYQEWLDSERAMTHARQDADVQQAKQVQARETLTALNQTRDGLTQALAKAPAWLSLLAFVPAIRRKHELTVLANVAVDSAELHQRLEATGLASGQRGRLELVMAQLQADIDETNHTLRVAEARHAAKQDEAESHRRRCDSLMARLKRYHVYLHEQLGDDTRAGTILAQADWCAQAETLLTIADEVLEPTQRFTLFRLATHYWEGRALLEARALLQLDQRELKRLPPIAAGGSWHPKPEELEHVLGLYAMVAPAIVSTFSSLPSLFQVYRGGRQTLAFGLADLLIVDEGGQISPDVAAPGFALAKRALVVGDTQQIAPVVTLGKTLERQNLAECELIAGTDDDDGAEAINALGQGPTQGSVMRIAQQSCAYHYLRRQRGFEGGPLGIFLDEHRRCFDEIIAYCNALCYDGLLTPKRGSAMPPGNDTAASMTVSPGDDPPIDRPALRLQQLQPLSFWHIDGQCQERGTSRVNETEALAVAQWIAEHAEALVARYSQGETPVALSRLVAVVTPFKAQAEAIKRELLRALGETASRLTVGTVHSLQGAERRVILFSGVYAGNQDGGFIDSAPSMLNVAVSRAKDHFIFVGDMHLLARQPSSTPRGLLYHYLTRRQGADIPQAFTPRLDSSDSSTVEVIFNHPDHDRLMFDAIANARQQVCILSPWVLKHQLERSEFQQALQVMRQRTADSQSPVRVWIYLDEHFSNSKWKDSHHDFQDYLQDFAERHDVTFRLCRQLHAKMLLVDSHLYVCGSFNWLSANRGNYQMLESSSVVRGPQARPLILQTSDNLAGLRARSTEISVNAAQPQA